MTIQFNTNSTVPAKDEISAPFIAIISKELSRFSERISRVLVHLTDEDGHKHGLNDKKCLIEARIEGMQPIAVSDYADTHHQSVKGASEKMKSSLTSLLGKLQDH